MVRSIFIRQECFMAHLFFGDGDMNLPPAHDIYNHCTTAVRPRPPPPPDGILLFANTEIIRDQIYISTI